MRSFIDKQGRELTMSGDHASYCRILKTTLRKYLLNNIRVKQHRDILWVETLQKYITDSQLKTIKKIYKDYRCLELVAAVNRELYRTVHELPKNKRTRLACAGRSPVPS